MISTPHLNAVLTLVYKPKVKQYKSYVHMRYNKTAIDDLMHPQTRKVTILRDPMDNFMSR